MDGMKNQLPGLGTNEIEGKALPSPKMSYTYRKNNNIRPHNDRKETNIHKVKKKKGVGNHCPKTLVKKKA